MNLFNALKGISYQVIQGEDVKINNLTIDSREVVDKTLFFCIKGLTVDGHDFIEEVAKKGANTIIIDEHKDTYPEVTVIKVPNVRAIVSKVASNFYEEPWRKFKLVGITGTNGKTSTLHFAESILKEYEKNVGVIGTVGSKIGDLPIDINSKTATTPDPVQLQQIFSKMAVSNISAAVMEVSSHSLALNKVDGVRFNVGIFTNISPEHLDFHKTMENYIHEKSKLFSKCDWGIINADSDAAQYIIEQSNCKILTYSIDKQSDLKATNIKYLSDGVSFDIEYDNHLEGFYIPIAGKFSVYNSLGAIGMALTMDIPIEVIKKGLVNMKGIPGRIQKVENDKGVKVIVDYAHTPDGLENIIKAVRDITKGDIVTVFGCGGDRDKSKRVPMGKIAGNLSDYCIITSDNPRKEEPQTILDEIEVGLKTTPCKYEKVVDRELAINLAITRVKEDGVVIIAGKGHENYQILKDTTIDFDDYEVALKAINDIKNN
jgi:UDP-N-acetylmuramoyl-L-alanyl-D-glutamate--2,6-diaminopimelate ligase